MFPGHPGLEMVETHGMFIDKRTVTKNSPEFLQVSPNQKDDKYSHNDQKKMSIDTFDKR